MIEAEHLSKRYGKQLAVDDLSFTAEPGTVTGFLGPNGAGKSTTLRMLVGLTPASSGSASVLGSDYRALANPARRVGVLLDASAQHSGRTGRETLRIAAQTIGVSGRRVDEVLEIVDLDASAAAKRVGGYSLGMRQRLGLAQVLLGDPEVLILDEPANGLDPEGIIWMRTLLRDLADRGGTVLLSSHLLREIEAVADRLVLISRGRVVAEGATDELLARSGTLVRSVDERALERVLTTAGVALTRSDGALVAEADPRAVGVMAQAAGLALTELRPAGNGGIEQLFLSLTASTQEGSDQ